MKSRCINSVLTASAVVFAALVMVPTDSISQDKESHAAKQDDVLDAEERRVIVETVCDVLKEYYIDKDMAEKMVNFLMQALKEGKYDAFKELSPFIRKLTSDLRSVSKDLHLGVWPFSPAYLDEEQSAEDEERLLEKLRYHNYGFVKVERLPGNIGYLELYDFENPASAGSTAVAAMNFLANSDALIIDLRRNGGGYGYMVNLICSYFFDEPVHGISVYSRFNNMTIQGWTQAYVQGPRMADIPVYVLQSGRTASAAEHLSYFLKAQGRAVIVGERSRGASNPAEYCNFPELSITVQVPAYKVSSPITGANWEGKGVEPDILVSAEQALIAACAHAAAGLLESESNEEIKPARRWAMERYEALLKTVEIDSGELNIFCGRYSRSYSVSCSNSTLYLARSTAMPEELIPLGNNLFAFKKREWRVQFVCGKDGKVSELIILYPDGHKIACRRIGDNK